MKSLLRISTLLLILFCMPSIVFAQQSALLSLHLASNNNIIHFEAKLNQPTTVHVFRLAHPSRIVLDFENTSMKASLKNINLPMPSVRAIRLGHPNKNVLRLVLDVDPRMRWQKRSLQGSAHVSLAFFPIIKKVQVAAAKKIPEAIPTKIIPETPRPIVIVIDPGHGGYDPGARGVEGAREKDVVLAIAKKLASEINQSAGMKAVLTRNGDYFVPLRGRLQRARHFHGDLFVSIHADSWFDREATGASAYTLSKHGATSEAARWLAGHENDSELAGVNLHDLGDQSVVLRSVLIDLAQTATINDSVHLARFILLPLKEVAGLHYHHVEQAPFMVLKSPDIPSVLVETGFLSNLKEEQRLRDATHQASIAHAIYLGISDYLKKYPPTAV